MKKIFVIGDSISIQYGPYLRDALSGVMVYSRKEGEDAALKDLDIPQGANGGDSDRVLEYLRARAGTGGMDADVILVNCGLHDIKKDIGTGELQVPLERYRKNLEEIVRVVRGMGRDMIWVRTTPCDEAVHNAGDRTFHRFSSDNEAYNAAADAIMAGAGVPALDLHTFTANLGNDLYCDHVHFHDDVREKQGAFIAGWLQGWASKGQGGEIR